MGQVAPASDRWPVTVLPGCMVLVFLRSLSARVDLTKLSNSLSPWDVVVVGAGPAGMLAAAQAAQRGRRTLLLEKNPKVGTKILMSGGTRCNLTHATDARGIADAFGAAGRFLRSALAALGPEDLVTLIESEGVPTKTEASGKVFPASDRAADVLRALLRRLDRSGCQLALTEPLTALERAGDSFRLATSRRVISAGRVIIATGGKSYPRRGTSGDGFAWLGDLGHTIVALRPALVPVTTSATWIPPLQGVSLSDVSIRVMHWPGEVPSNGWAVWDIPRRKQNVLTQHRGPLLFTHFGLSGPAVLNVSRGITTCPEPAGLAIVCDFLPGTPTDQFDEEIRQRCAAAGGRSVLRAMPNTLPRRFAESILGLCGLEPTLRAAGLSRGQRRQLVSHIKGIAIRVTGTRGFDKAEVTAGGLALGEVNSNTMESRIVPGLFVAGEILDLDGPIGGYNFQAAFSTGWLAGLCV